MVLSLCLALPLHAQSGGARRAIEQLEKCDREPSCVKILKRKPLGDNKQAIKAQVRGGRIIWYEYDTRTGKVRRTN